MAVRDAGVDIAPEDQETVFEELRQVRTADKKAEGTGFGLALYRLCLLTNSNQSTVNLPSANRA